MSHTILKEDKIESTSSNTLVVELLEGLELLGQVLEALHLLVNFGSREVRVIGFFSSRLGGGRGLVTQKYIFTKVKPSNLTTGSTK